MNKELVEKYKVRLEDELKRLRTILGRTSELEGSGEFPGEYKPKYVELGSDEGENASEVEKFATDLSVTQDLESRLTKVMAALDRIKDGTYGQCLEGDEIEEARLDAEPAAETCIKHSK